MVELHGSVMCADQGRTYYVAELQLHTSLPSISRLHSTRPKPRQSFPLSGMANVHCQDITEAEFVSSVAQLLRFINTRVGSHIHLHGPTGDIECEALARTTSRPR